MGRIAVALTTSSLVSIIALAACVGDDPNLGSSDSLIAGAGDNLIFGGAGNDAIRVGNGNNVVLGGNGEATFTFRFVFSAIKSTDSAYAGTDRIMTGTGQNIVLQGSVDQSVPRLSLPVWQFEASAAPAATASEATPISVSQLNAVVLEAEQIWAQALGAGDAHLAALSHVTVELGDLPQGGLGATFGDVVVIDPTASGWGWFTGGTEGAGLFRASSVAGSLTATPGSAAAGHMDLLSTVLHELGNAMGFKEDAGNDVTGRVLEAGERRLPVVDVTGLVRQDAAAPGVPATPPSHAQVAAKLTGVADRLAAPAPTHSAGWLDDFINHEGQGPAVRAPNAGLRVRIPASGPSAPF